MSKQNKSKNFTKHGADYVTRHQDEKDRSIMAKCEPSERNEKR